MAFKLALIAAVLLAQGFAFKLRLRGGSEGNEGLEVCKNPTVTFPYELDEAVQDLDEVREVVSMAALDSYAGNGNNIKVIIACYRQQRGKYLKLGLRLSKMITEASIEMSLKFADKANRYTKLIEPPMIKIGFTIVGVVDQVYTYMKDHQYLKAAEAVIVARRVIDENAREVAKHIVDLAREMPEFAQRANELARGIRNEARETSNAIKEAFKTCLEEGGVHTPSFKEEDEDEDEEVQEEEIEGVQQEEIEGVQEHEQIEPSQE